jgi:hypothetical protein
MESTTALLIAIILLVVVILMQEEDDNYSQEHLQTWGSALMQQNAKEPAVLVAQDSQADVIRKELSNRMECMTSPENNTESPLEQALHGNSAVNAL